MDEPISPVGAKWGAEPSITDDEDGVPISTVCRRVDTFADPLPDESVQCAVLLATQEHLKREA
jgi:hypothetical protein